VDNAGLLMEYAPEGARVSIWYSPFMVSLYGVAPLSVSGDHCGDMTEYSETFLDHYRRPRNSGDLEDPDAVAIVHNDVCGDVLRLAIRVEPAAETAHRRIVAVRFKAYGCAATIAVASVISEMVVGKRVGEIKGLGADDVVAALDGLPPGRIHAVTLGRAALRDAIARL